MPVIMELARQVGTWLGFMLGTPKTDSEADNLKNNNELKIHL